MYYHYIFMFTDYEEGIRKAYFKSTDLLKDLKNFKYKTSTIKRSYKNISFSTHMIMTNSKKLTSIIEYDKYFNNVVFYSKEELFLEELNKCIKITPSDILKYILINKECTKIEAMELIYLINKRYFIETGSNLFEEDIHLAINSAYQRLERYKLLDVIKLKDIELEKAKLNLKLNTVNNRDNIVRCINSVIKNANLNV